MTAPPTRAPKPSAPCPCTSGRAYGACCRPLHLGERAAADAVEIVRSRYAAFAIGDVDYLVATLHPGHPDASVPREALRATLREAARAYKYTGLAILESRTEADQATVVFRAKVFDKGKDLSFTEASTFLQTAEGWRYLSGETVVPKPR